MPGEEVVDLLHPRQDALLLRRAERPEAESVGARMRLDALHARPDPLQEGIEVELGEHHADRAGDRGRMGDDGVGRHRHPVSSRPGYVGHADHHGLAGGARLLDRAAHYVGSHRGAAGAVDAEDDGLDRVVLGCLTDVSGDPRSGEQPTLEEGERRWRRLGQHRTLAEHQRQAIAGTAGATGVARRPVLGGIDAAVLVDAGRFDQRGLDLVEVPDLVGEPGLDHLARGEHRPLEHALDRGRFAPASHGHALDEAAACGLEHRLERLAHVRAHLVVEERLARALVVPHHDDLGHDVQLVERAAEEGRLDREAVDGCGGGGRDPHLVGGGGEEVGEVVEDVALEQHVDRLAGLAERVEVGEDLLGRSPTHERAAQHHADGDHVVVLGGGVDGAPEIPQRHGAASEQGSEVDAGGPLAGDPGQVELEDAAALDRDRLALEVADEEPEQGDGRHEQDDQDHQDDQAAGHVSSRFRFSHYLFRHLSGLRNCWNYAAGPTAPRPRCA